MLAGESVAAPMPLGGGRNRRGFSCRLLEAEILGPSGDELDKVAEEVLLPKMQLGDWLLFPCLGAAALQEFGELQVFFIVQIIFLFGNLFHSPFSGDRRQ